MCRIAKSPCSSAEQTVHGPFSAVIMSSADSPDGCQGPPPQARQADSRLGSADSATEPLAATSSREGATRRRLPRSADWQFFQDICLERGLRCDEGRCQGVSEDVFLPADLFECPVSHSSCDRARGARDREIQRRRNPPEATPREQRLSARAIDPQWVCLPG
jgi:hypothetical protein